MQWHILYTKAAWGGAAGYKASFSTAALTLPVREYHPVPLDGDLELFPGLRIITLPGHTSNLLGLMVTTDSGKSCIFPPDTVPPKNLPGTCGDEKAYKASCEKIRRSFTSNLLFCFKGG